MSLKPAILNQIRRRKNGLDRPLAAGGPAHPRAAGLSRGGSLSL